MSSRTPGVAATQSPADSAVPTTSDDVVSDATTGVDEASVIGVDPGVRQLVTAVPASAPPAVPNALVVDGEPVRELFSRLGDVLRRLDARPTDTAAAERRVVDRYRALLQQRIEGAVDAIVRYADRLGADVVAIEDTPTERRGLAECARGRTKPDAWIFPVLQQRLDAVAAAAGVRVKRVRPKFSTKQCHVCGDLMRSGAETVVCSTDDCPVGEVCRDRSAAVTIARRGARAVSPASR